MTSNLNFFGKESSGAPTVEGPEVHNGQEGEQTDCAVDDPTLDAKHAGSGMENDDFSMEIAHDESIGSPLRCNSSLRTGMCAALRNPMRTIGMHDRLTVCAVLIQARTKRYALLIVRCSRDKRLTRNLRIYTECRIGPKVLFLHQ
jgi:hypothetical protein